MYPEFNLPILETEARQRADYLLFQYQYSKEHNEKIPMIFVEAKVTQDSEIQTIRYLQNQLISLSNKRLKANIKGSFIVSAYACGLESNHWILWRAEMKIDENQQIENNVKITNKDEISLDFSWIFQQIERKRNSPEGVKYVDDPNTHQKRTDPLEKAICSLACFFEMAANDMNAV